MKITLKGFLITGLLTAACLSGQAAPEKSIDFRGEKTLSKAKSEIKASSRSSASGIPSKKVYAWSIRDAKVDKGIVSFNLDTPNEITSEFPLSNLAYAGCYGNGKYYFDRYKNTSDSWEHIAFSSVDLATGKVTDISNWSNEYFVVNDMTYDHNTNTIYAMIRTIYMDDFLAALQFEYSALCTIDPNSGVLREVKQFIDWGNAMLAPVTYYTLACDLNGDLYAIDGAGYLVKFDKNNDYAEIEIGPTGVSDIAHNTQTMEFDPATGSLYWCLDHSKSVSELIVIDPVTGRSEVVGPTGNDSHLVGLYIPFDVPSAAAPAAVNELTATPDAAGANNITINWTNPTKSFGGANLASISSVVITRDDVQVASLSGVKPGEEMTWTDDKVPAAGNYTYTVTCVNAAGKGLVSGLTRWVGLDLPSAVTKLGIGKTDEGYCYLEWEAPEKGIHAGVIDTESLGYKIIRFPDGTIIANDYRDTNYTDKTIPGIGRYYYTIEPHTSSGVGEAKNTVEIALGTGIENYPWSTLFTDLSEFDLWTVDNHNGGETWIFKSNTVTSPNGGKYYTQAKYTYDKQEADDYLISPDLYMKKGGRYKVKFAYSGSNTYHTEKLEVTFGQGKTAADQTEVLKSFTMKDGTMRYAEIEFPEITESGNYNFAFHAISDPEQLGINVTDVTVSMTVAPPDDEETDPDDEEEILILPAPGNLQVEVEDNKVTLTWDEASEDNAGSSTPSVAGNIVEDFESMIPFTINPEGNYGWTYIDGDGGITYVDDFGYEYENDGTPKAAMVMNPSLVGNTFIAQHNPPHSGNQYLLFESNFSAGDGSRPAPIPDDWFISPKLNFDSEFIFSFYCKADPDKDPDGNDDYDFGVRWNTEQFRVGYSTTGNSKEDFIWMTDNNESITTLDTEWVKKEYVLPADAKYVCIHYCTPDNGYWFMVDDVFIGIPTRSILKAKAEPIFYYYEVLVDDVVVATTQECTHVLDYVEKGTHVAKVRAVYKQGNSEAATAGFTVTTTGEDPSVDPDPDAGVNMTDVNLFSVERIGNVLNVSGCEIGMPLEVYGLNGAKLYRGAGESQMIDVSSWAPGVYVLVNGNKAYKFVK